MSEIDKQEKQSSDEGKDLLTARMNSQLKGARNQYSSPPSRIRPSTGLSVC